MCFGGKKMGSFILKKIEDLDRVFPYLFENKVQKMRQKLQAITEDSSYQYLHVAINLGEIQANLPKIKLARMDFLLQSGCLDIFKRGGDPRKRDAYLKYAQKYKPKILKNGKFVIHQVADLDNLYHTMRGAYYTPEVGEQEQRVAIAFEKNNPRD